MKTNENHWSFTLWSELYGKGASLNITAHGYNDFEVNHIGLVIRHKEDYISVPQRRRGSMVSSYIRNLIHSTGICWICGEIHPRVLERHHLYESRSKNKHGNTLRTDFVCGICANCHRKRKVTGGETERHQIAILKAIEQEMFGLGGKNED